MLDGILVSEVIATMFYTILGLILLGLSWKIIEWVSPFSLRKEIEDDQNLAIAVLIGSLFISIAILISSVIISG